MPVQLQTSHGTRIAAGLHVRGLHALPGLERAVHAEVRPAGVRVVPGAVPQRAAVRAQQQPWGRRCQREPAGAFINWLTP